MGMFHVKQMEENVSRETFLVNKKNVLLACGNYVKSVLSYIL